MTSTVWQSPEHAVQFDFRSAMPLRMLRQDYERFNDVRMLNTLMVPTHSVAGHTEAPSLLEVGSACGTFYKYLRAKYGLLNYIGCDISEPAVKLARERYGPHFFTERSVAKFDLVYCKDVVQHQDDPWAFIDGLIAQAKVACVFRCRTHRVAEASLRQRHYGGDVSFKILDINQLRRWLSRYDVAILTTPSSCWDETSVRVDLRRPPELFIMETPEPAPRYALWDRAVYWARRKR